MIQSAITAAGKGILQETADKGDKTIILKNDANQMIQTLKRKSVNYCGQEGYLEEDCHHKQRAEKLRKSKHKCSERNKDHADVTIAAVDKFPRYVAAL